MSADRNEHQFIRVDRHRLAPVAATGEASVVLIHAIPTYSYLWRNVAPRLAASGLPTISVDLLGYGFSDKPIGVDLGIAAQARILATALELMKWRGGRIVGHAFVGGVGAAGCLGPPPLRSPRGRY